MSKIEQSRTACILAAVFVASLIGNAQAQDITYSRDIAPILQEKCVTCHNPEGIGPMPLQSYQQVNPFAALIKDRTSKRIMPPWHIDTTTGIQEFKNDASLSDEQIATISSWVDSGAPEGNPTHLPTPIDIPSGSAWQLTEQLGPPDLIIKSTPFDVLPMARISGGRPTCPLKAWRKIAGCVPQNSNLLTH